MSRFKGGEIYRSGYELSIATQLEELHIPFEYETEQLEYFKKRRNTECNNCGSTDVWERHWYTPDFVILTGDKYYVETKGRFTATDRTKIKAVIDQHPELDLRLLFMRDNRIQGKKGERYSEWAERNGLRYAVGSWPEDWT